MLAHLGDKMKYPMLLHTRDNVPFIICVSQIDHVNVDWSDSSGSVLSYDDGSTDHVQGSVEVVYDLIKEALNYERKDS